MHLLVSLCLSAVALAVAPPPPEAGRRRAVKSQPGEGVSYEDLDNYDLNLDNYGESIDLSNYEDLYDYSDPGPK
ncbi:hypothetical protein FKM82_027047, partial [Ascaphus truei]